MAFFAIAETQATNDLADLPPWFLFNVNVCSEWTDDDQWKLIFYVFLKPSLSENQSFEERNGIKTLVEIDPASGKKAAVILHGAFEEGRVDLFELKVDTINNRVIIVRATDLGNIHAEDLFLPIAGEAGRIVSLKAKCLALLGGTLPIVARAQ